MYIIVWVEASNSSIDATSRRCKLTRDMWFRDGQIRQVPFEMGNVQRRTLELPPSSPTSNQSNPPKSIPKSAWLRIVAFDLCAPCNSHSTNQTGEKYTDIYLFEGDRQ